MSSMSWITNKLKKYFDDSEGSKEVSSVGNLISVNNRSEKKYGLGYSYSNLMKIGRARKELYKEYMAMDDTVPEYSSVLDIYTSNIAKDRNQNPFAFSTTSKDKITIETTTELNKIVEEYISLITRDVCKMGDSFWNIVFLCEKPNKEGNEPKKISVKRMRRLMPDRIIREENEHGDLKGFRMVDDIETAQENEGRPLNKEANIHFRLRTAESMYGKAIARSIINVTKKLGMMEDTILITAMEAAPSRLAWGVDTGSMQADESLDYCNTLKFLNRRQEYADREGNFYNDIVKRLADSDVFYPVGENNKSTVDKLYREVNFSSYIAVIEYFHNKMLSALKTPRSFLSFEVNISSKAVVVEQSIEFGKIAFAIQKEIARGLWTLAKIVFGLRDLDSELAKLSLNYPEITVIDNLRKWQVELEKSRVVEQLTKFYPLTFVTKYVYGLDDATLKRMFTDLEMGKYDEYVAIIAKLRAAGSGQAYMDTSECGDGSSDDNNNKGKDFTDKQVDNGKRKKDIDSGKNKDKDATSAESEESVDIMSLINEINLFVGNVISEQKMADVFDLD